MRGARHAVAHEAADSSASTRTRRDKAIDWLCLSLPESELPMAFGVRQRIQIVRPRAYTEPVWEDDAPMDGSVEDPDEDAEGEGRSNTGGEEGTDQECEVAQALASGAPALLTLLEAIEAEVGPPDEAAVDMPSAEEAAAAAEEEEAVLESIYGEENFSVANQDGAVLYIYLSIYIDIEEAVLESVLYIYIYI